MWSPFYGVISMHSVVPYARIVHLSCTTTMRVTYSFHLHQMILRINNHVLYICKRIPLLPKMTHKSWFQSTGKRGKTASSLKLTHSLHMTSLVSSQYSTTPCSESSLHYSYQCKQCSRISHGNSDLCWDWFLCVDMTVTCVGQSAKTHAKDMRVYHYLVPSGAWEQGQHITKSVYSFEIVMASFSLANVETKG